MTRNELINFAIQDSGLSWKDLPGRAGITEAQFDQFMSLGTGISTADVARLEGALGLPQDSLLTENNNVHRTVVYQDFITPRGLVLWIKTLEAYVATYGSFALPELRNNLVRQIKNHLLEDLRHGSISEGRYDEIIGGLPTSSLARLPPPEMDDD